MAETQERGVRTIRDRFNAIAMRLTKAVGSPFALALAFGLIVAWLLTGPMFGFSDTWQLFINTTTTIVTFLMVFVIQASQNRDSKALHLKLDEIIRSNRRARNEIIDAEQETEAELDRHEHEFLEIARKGAEAASRQGTTLRTDAKAPAVPPSVRAAARKAAERTLARSRPAAPPKSSRRSGGQDSG